MHFIEVNGVGLRYELSGSGERTVVLIHEMGGSLESWDEVAPVLAAQPARAALRHARGRAVGEGAGRALHRHHGGRSGRAARCAAASPARWRSPASPSAGRSRCMRRCACPSASRRSWSAALPPASLPTGARRVLARVERIEREGMRMAVEDFDGQRLCAGAARRRGALCRLPRPLARQRSGELRRHLPHAGRHGPAGGACPHRLPRAGAGRPPRPRAPAGAGRAGRPRASPARATRCWRPATTWRWRRRSSSQRPSASSLDRTWPSCWQNSARHAGTYDARRIVKRCVFASGLVARVQALLPALRPQYMFSPAACPVPRLRA